MLTTINNNTGLQSPTHPLNWPPITRQQLFRCSSFGSSHCLQQRDWSHRLRWQPSGYCVRRRASQPRPLRSTRVNPRPSRKVVRFPLFPRGGHCCGISCRRDHQKTLPPWPGAKDWMGQAVTCAKPSRVGHQPEQRQSQCLSRWARRWHHRGAAP